MANDTRKWPNHDAWSALVCKGAEIDGERCELFVADCGTLVLPSGKLVACDPFGDMKRGGNAFVQVPPGGYPVFATLADFGDKRDRLNVRQAYATLMLSDEPEATRETLTPLREGKAMPQLAEGEHVCFRVDTSTACFVDDEALIRGMPEQDEWEELFQGAGGWFDPETHFLPGLSRASLPLATDESNIVIFHGDWGDGLFPLVGGYSQRGDLVRVHIDFGIIG